MVQGVGVTIGADFENQVLPQLDLLRCGHELRPCRHAWMAPGGSN